MRLPFIAFVGIASLITAGCVVGGWGQVKTSPVGGWAKLSIASGDVFGELLLADDAAALMKNGDDIFRVPWTRVRSVRIKSHSVSVDLGGFPPQAGELRAMRRASRYPFGLTDEQLQHLLESVGRESVREMR